MTLDEESCRRPGWTEGRWIVLGGEAWCFPPPGEVPGYREAARRIVKAEAGGLPKLADVGSPDVAASGDEGASLGVGIATRFRTIEAALGLYRIVHRAGSLLLRENYKLTEQECRELLPFDYSVVDLSDPDSPLNTATPEELAACNQVAAVLGIDLGEMTGKINPASRVPSIDPSQH